MVGSIDPRREAHRRGHWRSDAAGVFGPRMADTILASGRVRPHPKGRTYDRKRSHPNPHQDPCKRGPSTYGPWPALPSCNGSRGALAACCPSRPRHRSVCLADRRGLRPATRARWACRVQSPEWRLQQGRQSFFMRLDGRWVLGRVVRPRRDVPKAEPRQQCAHAALGKAYAVSGLDHPRQVGTSPADNAMLGLVRAGADQGRDLGLLLGRQARRRTRGLSVRQSR